MQQIVDVKERNQKNISKFKFVYSKQLIPALHYRHMNSKIHNKFYYSNI